MPCPCSVVRCSGQLFLRPESRCCSARVSQERNSERFHKESSLERKERYAFPVNRLASFSDPGSCNRPNQACTSWHKLDPETGRYGSTRCNPSVRHSHTRSNWPCGP